MSKVSVEYAHIYTKQRISDEHKISLDTLQRVKDNIEQAGDDALLLVMVDDYSFPDTSFDYGEFTDWLVIHGFKPDLMIRESQLIPVCDAVVNLIQDSRLKDELIDYIQTKKYPCSLFIAAWYLLRAGKVSSSIFPEELVADKILNILPESFKPFEDKGLEIISATQHADLVDDISYEFIPGRSVVEL
jgi:hypothetical protein